MVQSHNNPFFFPLTPLLDIQRSLGEGILGTLAEGVRPGVTRGHLFQDPDGATWVAQVAGVRPGDLEFTVDGRQVNLKALAAAEEGAEAQTSFEHNLRLPFEVDSEGVQANLLHGLLLIRLPRKQNTGSRRIPISGN
ncbi:MAG: Hsp20 family protein [Planctomycetota bacterium]